MTLNHNPRRRAGARAALVILTTAALGGSAFADPHADAKAADARGDYATELAILQPHAAQGEPWAQNNLGNLYLFGNGVPEDNGLAFAWFAKAAAQGDPGGEVNLGQMYEQGLGVPSDPTRAASLYRKAAEQGRVSAWGMLKRLCDSAGGRALPDCASVPAGTKSAPQWDFHGKGHVLLFILLRLLVAAVAIVFAVRGFMARRRAKQEVSVGAAVPSDAVVPTDPLSNTAAVQVDSKALTRFILVGSVSVTALILIPVAYIGLRHPGADIWSPAMVLWIATLWVAWGLVIYARMRKLRQR